MPHLAGFNPMMQFIHEEDVADSGLYLPQGAKERTQESLFGEIVEVARAAPSDPKEGFGANVAGVPVDDQGLVVGQLPPAARIVYLTPSHQYPLGVVMSMARRRELLAWARRHDAAVIEDDYDSEFRYVDRPLEPLQRLDDSGSLRAHRHSDHGRGQ